jgi:hypothetical protein
MRVTKYYNININKEEIKNMRIKITKQVGDAEFCHQPSSEELEPIIKGEIAKMDKSDLTDLLLELLEMSEESQLIICKKFIKQIEKVFLAKEELWRVD